MTVLSTITLPALIAALAKLASDLKPKDPNREGRDERRK